MRPERSGLTLFSGESMRKTDWKIVLASSVWMFAGTVWVSRLINASTRTEDDAILIGKVIITIGVFLAFLASVLFRIKQIRSETTRIQSAISQRDAVIDRQIWRIRTQDAALKRFVKLAQRANIADASDMERKAIASEIVFLESLIRTEEHHP